MMDTHTRERLTVSFDGTYLVVPFAQLDVVERLLKANHVRFQVSPNAVSLNGEPEVVLINLRRGSDPNTVQNLLDSLP